MKAWDGKQLTKLENCRFADRIIYHGLLICKVGKKTKNGRMVKSYDPDLPSFFVQGDTVVDRNYWLNLHR